MSRQTPFQEKHKIEFGLAPVQRAPDGTIMTVQCLFCVQIEHEKRDGPAIKRQCTKNVQLFQFPFRPECYKSHMQSQHTDEWVKYQTFSPANKLAYFNKKEATGINAFLDKDRDNLTFAISQPAIVDDIVGNLFFNPKEDEEDDDSEPITKANAMKLFKLQEDGSYLVIIKNSLRFNLTIEHVFVGLSFRQIAVVITQHRNLCKNSKLASLNDHMVGQFVRVLLAVALQSMSTIMNQKHVWAFSLATDASSHMGVSLLDQHIRICVEGVLYNLHMVLVPFFERHLAVN
jgi:hypothetical protein